MVRACPVVRVLLGFGVLAEHAHAGEQSHERGQQQQQLHGSSVESCAVRADTLYLGAARRRCRARARRYLSSSATSPGRARLLFFCPHAVLLRRRLVRSRITRVTCPAGKKVNSCSYEVKLDLHLESSKNARVHLIHRACLQFQCPTHRKSPL